MYQLGVSSTAACDYVEIGRRQVLNGGLPLNFGVMQQRSELVEIRKAHNNRDKTLPPIESLNVTCRQLLL